MAPENMVEQVRSSMDKAKYVVCNEDPGSAALRFVVSV